MLKAMKFLHQKDQDHVPCSFTHIVVCIDDRFGKPIVDLEMKVLLMNLLKQFLRSMITAKR